MLHFSLPSFNPFKIFASEKQVIDISPVKVHEIDNAQEKSARALKHLLKLNHANYAILYNERKFHNHAPHVRIVHLSARFQTHWLTLSSSSALRSCRARMRMT